MKGPSRKFVRRVVMLAVLLLVVLWGIGEWMRPATSAEALSPILADTSDPVLRRACFDCPSNQTQWPWYVHVPGVGIVLSHDVNEARGKLNFSDWSGLSRDRQAKQLREARQEVLRGGMPPLNYKLLHPEARLAAADKAQLAQDLGLAAGLSPAAAADVTLQRRAERDHDDDD